MVANNNPLRRAGAIEQRIREFAYAARHKTCTAFQMSLWVLNNLEIDWQNILSEDIPSAGNVALLRMAKANDKSRDLFRKEFVAKTVPTTVGHARADVPPVHTHRLIIDPLPTTRSRPVLARMHPCQSCPSCRHPRP